MQASSSSSLPRHGVALLAAAALLVAGVLLVLYALAARSWYEQPFLGVLPLRDLEISGGRSLTGAEWVAPQLGLLPGDQINAVAGVNVGDVPLDERIDRYRDALNDATIGARVPLSFYRRDSVSPERPVGAQCVPVTDTIGLRKCGMNARLEQMPFSDLLVYFGMGWIAALVLWLAALLLFMRQWRTTHVQVLTILSAALSVFMAGHFDTFSTHQWAWAWLVAGCLAGGMLVVFALEFPYRFATVQESPLLAWAPAVVSLALGLASATLYYASDPNYTQGGIALALGTLILGGLILAGMMIWRRARSASPIVRNQSTMIIIGLFPALLPVGYWFGAQILSHLSVGPVPFEQIVPILFPFSAMYAVMQYRLVDTDRVITQTWLYVALLAMLTLSYFLVVGGLALVINNSLRDTALNPLLITLSIFALAALFTPVRAGLQHTIDSLYFRARRQYQTFLEQFARDMTNAIGLADVNRLIQGTLAQTLAPVHVILFVRDAASRDYRSQPDPATGQRLTDVIFTGASGLVRYLNERGSILYLEEGRPMPLDVVSDRSKLALLGAPLMIGLRGQRGLNGFIAIGPRQNGAPYLHEDLRFIESLSDQIALAVERAQAVDDLERRVRVQDVLSQVSRALNFAIDFDTLLELIYAQTLRVIDAPCFYIALRNPTTNELSYVFYNEGDDRIPENEGKRWRMGRDLISEIARSQQTIRTDDYVRESLARDPHTVPDNPNLKAWMGVPLLADTGEGVLGVMVAASTEPGRFFTDDQQDLFWDIANLASSAIDKLQLFDKTQLRARQLAAINEIANQLAIEMGNVDRLLKLITENAVHILNAEAGSLLLVDSESGELEFHVVVGGRGQDLIGTRLPPGSGLAGATVQRGVPIIVNDPSRDSRWYGDIRATSEKEALAAGGNGQGDGDGSGSSAGASDGDEFHSDAILSVPLMVGGRAIGVLQCLNKQDGSIFIQEDADLLETFAGQAAIAIENARLFDMTDQQLALRVQELDTMQRIDQELNRTLRLQNVVDITMDWGMRKSGATAGALLIRDRERGELQVIASYGYPHGTPFYRDAPMIFPDDWGVVGRVVRSAQPSLITNVSIDPDYEETLAGCTAQLTVPLFSANQVIGVIMFESDREGELDLLDLDFVARLAEHASPAIINSQLFRELERANEDKSTFVSLVAHELKNPMTSMKGFTDLLIKGIVGPVNEQQSDFLKTILNNVNRMETLVSDLNDLTKQQTGNMRLDMTAVDFRNIVIETLRAQQRQIEDKQQELIVEVPEDLPLVRGDHNRLIQIMTNFVSNAHKYTPTGGTITLRAEHTRNVWDLQGAPRVIHCSVQDTGIGMNEDDQARLFTPYFRSDNPLIREQPGTGLGLTITRGLIEQHGGTVWLESAPDQGSTFHFTIPVATEDERERARAGV